MSCAFGCGFEEGRGVLEEVEEVEGGKGVRDGGLEGWGWRLEREFGMCIAGIARLEGSGM